MSNEIERVPAEVFPPSDFINEEIRASGWTNMALSQEMDCKLTLVDELLSGNRRITLMIAHMLSSALGTSVAFWINLQKAYDKDGSNSNDQ